MTPRALVVGFIAVGLLSGCAAASESDSEPPEPVASQEPAPPERPAPPEGLDPSDESPSELGLGPCSGETREAIENTVVGQVSAFSAGDFEAAYAFASPSFQEGMPLDVFGPLIRINYPQLLEASNARSGPCDADLTGGFSTIVMRFDTPTDPNYTLRYVLERVGEQWRIAGAQQETVADIVA